MPTLRSVSESAVNRHVFLALLLALSSGCGGGSSEGLRTSPVTAVFIQPTSLNASGFINTASQNAVFVGLELASDVRGRDHFIVSLRDATGAVVTLSMGMTSLRQVLIVGPYDASALVDGPIVVDVVVPGIAPDAVSFGGFQKDVVAPSPIDALFIGSNPGAPTMINATDAGALIVGLQHAAGFALGETAEVCFTSQSTEVCVASGVAPGGSTSPSVGPADIAAFGDGPVTVSVTRTDAAGNSTSSSFVLVKDTFVATAVQAFVEASAGHGADVVNQASAAGIAVTAVVTATTPAPPGGGAIGITGLDVRALGDGPLAITARLRDVAGNETAFVGTPAFKDTLPPVGPSLFRIGAGAGNGVGTINQSSVGGVVLTVHWDASNQGDETAVVTLSGGGAMIGLPSFAPPSGGGAQSLGPISAVSMPDGVVSLAVVMTDPFGNVSTTAGTPGSKDTLPPAGPSAATVAAGANNASGVINATTCPGVAVTATFGAASLATDLVTVTLADGARRRSDRGASDGRRHRR